MGDGQQRDGSGDSEVEDEIGDPENSEEEAGSRNCEEENNFKLMHIGDGQESVGNCDSEVEDEIGDPESALTLLVKYACMHTYVTGTDVQHTESYNQGCFNLPKARERACKSHGGKVLVDTKNKTLSLHAR